MGRISSKGDKPYVASIDQVVADIDGNPVGQVITTAIRATKHELIIHPLSELKTNGARTCRGVTTAIDQLTSSPKGSGGDSPGFREKRYLGESDTGFGDDDDARYNADDSGKVGLGGGSKVFQYFTPGEWGKNGCYAGEPGQLADEVLIHEMVHALRMMQGLWNPIPTSQGLKAYDTEEEFLAIVVCNVFISAKDRTRPLKQPRPLVANHRTSGGALWYPLNTSKGFLDDRDNRRLMSIYMFDWRPIFRELAALKAIRYNPFWEAVKRL